jgi:hypothetical protein
MTHDKDDIVWNLYLINVNTNQAKIHVLQKGEEGVDEGRGTQREYPQEASGIIPETEHATELPGQIPHQLNERTSLGKRRLGEAG